MVQYSNSAKTCLQSEKFGSILSAKTCRESEKGDTILKQSQKLSLSEKDGTILKQCQNLSPARKGRYNTQTEPKPVSSQKKMVQYSNRAKTFQQAEKRL